MAIGNLFDLYTAQITGLDAVSADYDFQIFKVRTEVAFSVALSPDEKWRLQAQLNDKHARPRALKEIVIKR